MDVSLGWGRIDIRRMLCVKGERGVGVDGKGSGEGKRGEEKIGHIVTNLKLKAAIIICRDNRWLRIVDIIGVEGGKGRHWSLR